MRLHNRSIEGILTDLDQQGMTSVSRRDFLKTTGVIAAGMTALGSAPAAASPRPGPRSGVTAGDPILREAAMQAIDAARRAGASYADVRVGASRYLAVKGGGGEFTRNGVFGTEEKESLICGLRVLVDGVFGFAHTRQLTPDGLALVAREAVTEAKVNARLSNVKTELIARPPVPNGEWNTPIKIDPFTIPIAEQANLASALSETAHRVDHVAGHWVHLEWQKEHRIFASTDGSLIAQTIYLANPYEGCVMAGLKVVPRFGPAAAGYEYIYESDLFETYEREVETVRERWQASLISADVGKFEIVLDSPNLAAPIRDTLGVPLELDRALGFEADASGTSFIAPPSEMLGTLALGTPLLTVHANRTAPGAAGRRWDDEGVEVGAYTIIENGKVMDYHTERQTAMELDRWYRTQGWSMQSHGCAVSESCEEVPMTGVPNLVMQASKDNTTVADLCHDIKRGYLFTYGGTGGSDQQGSGGMYQGVIVREIRNGKLGRFVKDAAIQFRTKELWRNLMAVGGAPSVATTGLQQHKGQPWQTMHQSVTAPAARFKDITVINAARGQGRLGA